MPRNPAQQEESFVLTKHVYMLIRTIALCTFILLLNACTKQQGPTLPFERTDFFSNQQDAKAKTAAFLKKLDPNDSLLAITNIAYVDTKDQTCAFVYFKGTKGNSNLVIRHTTAPNGQRDVTVIKCEGTGCDCKVTTIVTNTGDVKTDCTCRTCTMLTTHLEIGE